METEQIRHQKYSASFSNSHKVGGNYQYLTIRFGRTSVRTFTLWFQIRMIPVSNFKCTSAQHGLQAGQSCPATFQVHYRRSAQDMHGPCWSHQTFTGKEKTPIRLSRTGMEIVCKVWNLHQAFEQERTGGSRRFHLPVVYFLFYCFRND